MPNTTQTPESDRSRPSSEPRQFRVHARHLDAHHARTVSESSFEAAATAYMDDLHDIGDAEDISVIVEEVATGHAHCFRIDVDTGDTAPCA